jgi:hypothetical protein
VFTHAEQELNVALGGFAWRGGPAAGSAAVDRWRAAQRRDGVRICGGRLCGGRLCGWFGAGRAAAGGCSAGARCGWQSAGGWRAARSGGDSSAGDTAARLGGSWQAGPWAGSGPKSSRGLAVGAVGRALGHERFERWRRLFVIHVRQAVGGWSAGAGRAAGGGAGRTASPVGS